MAARQTLRLSSSSMKALLSPSSSKASKFTGLASSTNLNSASSRFSLHKLGSSRLPVELASLQSLMPLHSVTSSALFTSLLSDSKLSCLSQGFTTPP